MLKALGNAATRRKCVGGGCLFSCELLGEVIFQTAYNGQIEVGYISCHYRFKKLSP